MRHFIEASELSIALTGDRPPVVLDLRFDPGKGSDISRYEQGHIVGARFVALEQTLVQTEAATLGPLPDPLALEESLRGLGLDNDTPVVVYDDTSGGPSARAWWVLTWAGATQVRTLNGGLAAWRAAGLPLVPGSDATPVAKGTFTVAAGGLASVEADDVEQIVAKRSAIVIDTRAPAHFAGDPEKARSGHIPGSVNLPQTAFRGADGRHVTDAATTDLLFSAGVKTDTDIVLSCGGGISSAYVALVLLEHGNNVMLYPGSFSDWVTNPAHPVEQSQSVRP
ncbi:sulfurtransferase [Paenarthrobacter sp. NPDC089316]|uniref:sulfurtransferase n=1 Tax=unclassified Paenarthrobacter TaxID=2634190 RepID=UPI00343BA905